MRTYTLRFLLAVVILVAFSSSVAADSAARSYAGTSQGKSQLPANADQGNLRVFVSDADNGLPVAGATVSVVEVGLSTITGEDGRTSLLALPAPDRDHSLQPDGPRFYATYKVVVAAPGFRARRYENVRIIADDEARLLAALMPLEEGSLDALSGVFDEVAIPEHSLWAQRISPRPVQAGVPLGPISSVLTPHQAGDRKAFQLPANNLFAMETLPATIVVHEGYPDNPADNVTVPFEEYVKGVLPNEWISSWWSTSRPWGRESLYSGALAVRSYAMNVIRTGKYRNRGYPFDITSTGYDQVWSGDLHYASTDAAVDGTAGRYLAYNSLAINARYGAHTGCPTKDESSSSQPYLKSVWDQVEADHGYTTTIGPGMSQWGSYWWSELGYSYDWIVKHYYTGVGILPANPTLYYGTSSLSFLGLVASAGGGAQARPIALTDDVGGTAWSAGFNSSGWLSVQPLSGTTNGNLIVTVNPVTGGVPLAKGRYQGTITISAPNATNPNISIPVTYVLTDHIYRAFLPKGAK